MKAAKAFKWYESEKMPTCFILRHDVEMAMPDGKIFKLERGTVIQILGKTPEGEVESFFVGRTRARLSDEVANEQFAREHNE
jgi:hypothetical protein